jgi:hypothetical protein
MTYSIGVAKTERLEYTLEGYDESYEFRSLEES